MVDKPISNAQNRGLGFPKPRFTVVAVDYSKFYSQALIIQFDLKLYQLREG